MVNLSQIISFFILGPLLFYPFSYCPFKLAYLYCFVCPAPCAWKRSRWVLLLIVLGLSIKKDSFCARLCPLGRAQSLLFKLKSRKFASFKFMNSFKYFILALIAVVVTVTLMPELLMYKFMGLSLAQIVAGRIRDLFLIILLFGAIASIFIYHVFCYNFCPIKAFNEIFAKIRK